MSKPAINYVEIVKEASRITWYNRYLWWLGFFLVVSGSFGSFFRYSPKQDRIEGQSVIDFTSTHKELVVVLMAIFIILLLILAILGIIAKGGLIKSINQIIENKENNLKKAFREGKKYFWKIFTIGILSALFIFAILVVFAVPIGFLFYNKAYFLGGLLSFLAIIIFVPVVFIVMYMRIYGYFYAIFSDLPVGEALENAYALLRKNVVPSILIAFTFLIISTLATIAAVVIFLPFLTIFFAAGALLFFLAKEIGLIIIGILAAICFLAIMFLGGAAYQVFTHSILVLFFREIAAPKIEEEAEAAKAEEISPASAPDPVAGN